MVMKKILGAVAFLLIQACAGDTAESAESPAAAGAVTDERPVVLFLGTSITAGLGVDATEAYPALIQAKVDAAGYDFRVVNAGSSGETSAGGLRRIDWLLRNPLVVLVIELGANDGLRGQDIEALRENLLEIIDRGIAAYPEITVLLAAMEAPPNMGDRYTEEFRQVFPAVASARGVGLIPFLLTGVGGVDSLNQVDGIHPNPRGHGIVANNVWAVLGEVLVGISGSD
jgi:acyl-CoA thioesterase-1